MKPIFGTHPRIVALICVCMGTAHAQYSYTIGSDVERIENPLLGPDSPGGATVMRLSPQLTLESQGDRNRSIFLFGGLLERSNNTELVPNRVYPRLGYTGSYVWPTARLELRANLAESATRNSQFEEQGRVTVDSRERTVGVGTTWDKELSAKARLGVDLANQWIRYDSSRFQDYGELTLSSRLSWEATDKSVVFLEPGYARLSPDDSDDDFSLDRLLVGMRAELAPEWSLVASAGAARTRGQGTTNRAVGGLQLQYNGSRLSSGIEWTRDLSASGLTSGYAAMQTLNIRTVYRVTEATTLSASWLRAQSDAGSGSLGMESRLTLEHDLDRNLSSSLGLQGRRSRDVSGAWGKGWAVRAGVVYAFPGR